VDGDVSGSLPMAVTVETSHPVAKCPLASVLNQVLSVSYFR
jgi:hypothetical protein